MHLLIAKTSEMVIAESAISVNKERKRGEVNEGENEEDIVFNGAYGVFNMGSVLCRYRLFV